MARKPNDGVRQRVRQSWPTQIHKGDGLPPRFMMSTLDVCRSCGLLLLKDSVGKSKNVSLGPPPQKHETSRKELVRHRRGQRLGAKK